MPTDRILVPLADPRGEAASVREELQHAFLRVVDSGVYILGAEVCKFEAAFAEDVGVLGAVGVASGTDALVLALLAVGVGSNDEVITVSHTAGPTVAAIRMIGAIPVLVDILEDNYCIDPSRIKAALSPRTKAIVAVHLYGHPADVNALMAVAHNVPIIEDCAQANGARLWGRKVGTLGAIGCFSFYPTKNLGGLGDGGAVVSNTRALLDRVSCLRTYGWTEPQFATMDGGRCSRLDEIQAAILSVKLCKLNENIERRRRIASAYCKAFEGLPLLLPRELPECSHSYHLYVVRSTDREMLEKHLMNHGIASNRHYPYPIHKQPAFARCARIPEPLMVTERIGNEILSLPMYATMKKDDIDRVIGAVREFYACRKGHDQFGSNSY